MLKIRQLLARPGRSGWIAIAVTIAVIVGAITFEILSHGVKPESKVASADTDGNPPRPLITSAPVPAQPSKSNETKTLISQGGSTPSGPTIVAGAGTGETQPWTVTTQQAQTTSASGQSTNSGGTTSAGAWTNSDQPSAPSPAQIASSGNSSGSEPTRVASNAALPPGGGTSGQSVTDTTSKYIESFSGDILTDRGTQVKVATNACLDQWVQAHVHNYDGSSVLTTQMICGVATAVIGGAAGIDDHVFVGQAQYNMNAAVKALLLGSSDPNLIFASARTGTGTNDNGTVLIAAADI